MAAVFTGSSCRLSTTSKKNGEAAEYGSAVRAIAIVPRELDKLLPDSLGTVRSSHAVNDEALEELLVNHREYVADSSRLRCVNGGGRIRYRFK